MIGLYLPRPRSPLWLYYSAVRWFGPVCPSCRKFLCYCGYKGCDCR